VNLSNCGMEGRPGSSAAYLLLLSQHGRFQLSVECVPLVLSLTNRGGASSNYVLYVSVSVSSWEVGVDLVYQGVFNWEIIAGQEESPGRNNILFLWEEGGS